MNKEEITDKLNYIDDELVKLQNAKAMKYLCNVEAYIDYLQQRIDKATEYINHFSKKSEVKINGLPDCKVFIGDIEQLLEILGGKE